MTVDYGRGCRVPQGRTRGVEELVLEPVGEVIQGTAMLGQVGMLGQEPVQFPGDDLVKPLVEAPQRDPGMMLVTNLAEDLLGLLVDDCLGVLDMSPPGSPIPIGLGLEVIDVIQQNPVDLADTVVEVTWNRDIQNQREPVASQFLDECILIMVDDLLVRRGGTDDQVGLDQRIVELGPWPGLAPPPGCGRLGTFGAPVDHEDPAQLERGEVLQGQLGHLAGTQHEDGLVMELAEDALSHLDGHAGNGELAVIQAGLITDFLADM